jgi:hypothetical protein
MLEQTIISGGCQGCNCCPRLHVEYTAVATESSCHHPTAPSSYWQHRSTHALAAPPQGKLMAAQKHTPELPVTVIDQHQDARPTAKQVSRQAWKQVWGQGPYSCMRVR